MDSWLRIYQEVRHAISELDRGTIWFRGHARASWRLVPSLARAQKTEAAHRVYASDYKREQGVYHRFLTDAGSLIGTNDGWSVAFAMQHHGVPTRLLDWSRTFAIALHFALTDCDVDGNVDDSAAIWVLDPHGVNETLAGTSDVLDVESVGGTYRDLFITRTKTSIGSVVAFDPPRHHPRVFNQRSGFTLHADMENSLDELVSSAVRKIEIPPEARRGAQDFLSLAGISEFSLFPDLDGLSREFRKRYF